MFATIRAIEYHLPESVVTNEDLVRDFPDWTMSKIAHKTGILHRHIAGPQECASDLAVIAAEKLFATGICHREEIDYLLLCTQSPDYILPTTACVLQDRLGLPTTIGALDFNLGCSGYVYGLSLARGLIETGQAKRVLLLTAETYSKHMHREDRSVRALFGDAATATLIEGRADTPDDSLPWIGPFVFGTDGRGRDNLIVARGGMRHPEAVPESDREGTSDRNNGDRFPNHLYMNGPEIFTFTLEAVPPAVEALLQLSGRSLESIDRFVFHQANRFMLEHLRSKLGIPPEKFVVALSESGNTVSSTIPIALKEARDRGQINDGQRIMLVGFGVGYSWGATLIRT